LKTVFNSKAFKKDMNNIMNYSIGFLEGAQRGKNALLHVIGVETIEILKEFIDSSARVNPEVLHHVYEWSLVGSPSARLYDINYTVSGLGLSIRSSFKQSTTIKAGSRVPFYDKATIIENGIPVTIKPTRAKALRFEQDGAEIFTKSPVTVENPGGTAAEKGFEKTMDIFFNRYFTQAFLKTSGIAKYLSNPEVYKKNLSAGRRGGKAKGIETGYRWIANAGVGR
jgi:hypothetical protein